MRFHAGDLNLWHWREENTAGIARGGNLCYQGPPLPKDKIDICFSRLDPNQGGHDAGANHLIMAVRPAGVSPCILVPAGNRERIRPALHHQAHGGLRPHPGAGVRLVDLGA